MAVGVLLRLVLCDATPVDECLYLFVHLLDDQLVLLYLVVQLFYLCF